MNPHTHGQHDGKNSGIAEEKKLVQTHEIPIIYIYILLYCIVLYYIILYYIIVFHIILYYVILCYIVLYIIYIYYRDFVVLSYCFRWLCFKFAPSFQGRLDPHKLIWILHLEPQHFFATLMITQSCYSYRYVFTSVILVVIPITITITITQ